MNKTAIQTSPKPAVPPTAPAADLAPPSQPVRQKGWLAVVRMILKPVASLKVTVTLFSLAILLIFLGTIAQVDQGIFTVLHKYFRTAVAWIPFQVFVTFGQKFFLVPETAYLPGTFPFPGGWLLGGLLLVNLLAAHGLWAINLAAAHNLTGTVLLKRSGVLMLHSGLVILMLGELVAGLFQVEGRMSIVEGRSSNFVEDFHDTELVVIDRADPKTDDVVSVPGRLVRKGGVIRNDLLPFDVRVDRFLVNSELIDAKAAGVSNPATAGEGLSRVAVEQPEVSGAASDQQTDMPSVYLTLLKKGTEEPLDTYLVSTYLTMPAPYPERYQSVTAGGKAYDLGFRFKRTYKPYTLHLNQFHHDVFIGTRTPRNYASDVRLIDPEQNENRQLTISMNDPLRHRGETFYQADFHKPPLPRGTILQVVSNPGWLMPYISCALVTVGMMAHFGIRLFGFIHTFNQVPQRRRAA